MSKWTISWGYLTTDFGLFPTRIKDETQRVLFCNNLAGNSVRIHFSNEFGRYPMHFNRVVLADAGRTAEVDLKTGISVTANGKTEWTLAPGEECYSDPLGFSVYPGQWISVSSYMEGEVTITSSAMCQERLVTKVLNNHQGDDCDKQSFPIRPQEEYQDFFRYKSGFQCFYGINRFEVLAEDGVYSIAAFGDSITHHGHWSQALALRLYERLPGNISLFNCGICGNRILHDASIRSSFAGNFGIRALDRFEKNVFDNGKRHIDLVILLIGINDIIHPAIGSAPGYEEVSSKEIIEGLKSLSECTHAHGGKIMVGTLLPYKNFEKKWSEKENSKRTEVNRWIRSNNICDGFFDGESAIQNPNDPDCILPEFDCGDNIHPSAAGGKCIANCINIDKICSLIGIKE